jgi:hypothetical protein
MLDGLPQLGVPMLLPIAGTRGSCDGACGLIVRVRPE